MSLPQLAVEKLSKEMTDFKKLMPLTLEQQRKKNRIADEIIAERADESDEE